MALDLDAIRARAEAATPGPWKVWGDDDGDSEDVFSVFDGEHNSLGLTGYYRRNALANAEFTANARQDIPDLLAEVERLQNRLELEQIYLERTVSRLDWWQNRHVNYVAEIAEILKRMQA